MKGGRVERHSKVRVYRGESVTERKEGAERGWGEERERERERERVESPGGSPSSSVLVLHVEFRFCHKPTFTCKRICPCSGRRFPTRTQSILIISARATVPVHPVQHYPICHAAAGGDFTISATSAHAFLNNDSPLSQYTIPQPREAGPTRRSLAV